MAPALVAAMILIYFGRYTTESQSSFKGVQTRKKWFKSRQAILFSSIALVVIMAALSIYFARSLAFDRLFDRGNVEGLRSQLLPILTKMMSYYFPWGSGFGSFEYVYRIYEPQELLNPSYLNQAHNDWLQFPIEGGLPAILIAAAAAIWGAIQIFTLAKNWNQSRYTKYTAIMTAMVMLIFLAGSIGDYPLRIPSLIAVFAVLACVLGDSLREVRRNRFRTKT